MNNLHPIFEQALSPFMPQTQAKLHAVDKSVELYKASFHYRNDDHALRFQMQAENTRTNFGENL